LGSHWQKREKIGWTSILDAPRANLAVRQT
jgi:hypothetical protein